MIIDIPPAVTIGSYAAGNAVGGKIALPDIGAGLAAPYACAITDVVLIDKAAQAVPYELLLFGADLAGTVQDKTAYTMDAADRAKCLGSLDLSGMKNYGTGIITLSPIYKRLTLTGRSGFAVLVTRGTPTYVSIVRRPAASPPSGWSADELDRSPRRADAVVAAPPRQRPLRRMGPRRRTLAHPVRRSRCDLARLPERLRADAGYRRVTAGLWLLAPEQAAHRYARWCRRPAHPYRCPGRHADRRDALRDLGDLEPGQPRRRRDAAVDDLLGQPDQRLHRDRARRRQWREPALASTSAPERS